MFSFSEVESLFCDLLELLVLPLPSPTIAIAWPTSTVSPSDASCS